MAVVKKHINHVDMFPSPSGDYLIQLARSSLNDIKPKSLSFPSPSGDYLIQHATDCDGDTTFYRS